MGGVWGSLGRLLGAPGRLLAVFWAFKMYLFLDMGPRWAPRGLLDRFWEGLGRVLGGFWKRFGKVLDGFWKDFVLESRIAFGETCVKRFRLKTLL